MSELARHLPEIDRVVHSLSRRKGLSEDDTEEFRSWLLLRLAESDAAPLRRFQGRCKFSTYLTAVVQRQWLDYQRERWGRWRPSIVAKRLGTTAVRLETLLSRDGVAFEEACEILKRNYGVRATDAELEEIAGKLPIRPHSRRLESDESLASVGWDGKVEERVVDAERSRVAARIESSLNEALGALDAEDRLVLKLLIEDSFTVADVARALHLDQKPLYRRIHGLTDELRRSLEAKGISCDQVDEIVGWDRAALSVNYQVAGEDRSPSPSQGVRRP